MSVAVAKMMNVDNTEGAVAVWHRINIRIIYVRLSVFIRLWCLLIRLWFLIKPFCRLSHIHCRLNATKRIIYTA